MPDRLLSLGQCPSARKVAGTLGISLPPARRREPGPWPARPLQDRPVVVGQAPGAELAPAVATTLARAGASIGVIGEPFDPFVEAGQAWSRPVRRGDEDVVAAVVVDASGVRDVGGLRALHDLLHPRVGNLDRCGRVVVLGRPPAAQASVAAAAAQRALDGFTRSLAKELGRKGSTANLVVVPEGAIDRLEPLLRFLLSDRSAFVSGQPFELSKSVRSTEARWTRPLDGKVALVTGAARGIGAATARALAREGARLVLLDRPEDEDTVAISAAETGGRPLLVDLVADDAPARVVEALEGGVDIVVHNAGITRDRTLGRMEPELWDAVLEVNLAAVLRLQEALEPLLRSHARVVCISSISGIAGNVGQSNYAASKAGLIGLVQALAPTLARRGIAVNAVAPGFIETRMTAAIPLATREVARRLSALNQGGLPEDVAEVVTFLASPGAAGLSGQVLRVCGGSLVGA